jgi:hypothetical protein
LVFARRQVQHEGLVPPSVRRERNNGGDVDAYRKKLHLFGVLATASSRDKRATFRGEFTPNEGVRPSRAIRRAMASKRGRL